MITNNKNYSVFCISHHAFIGMFFFCLAGPLWGQANKKIKVPPSNYKQWHTLVPDQVSNDGIWFSYGLYYDTGQDTLVVQHVEKKVKYQLPNAFFSSFSSNSKWVFSRTRDHIFWMVNLHAGKEKKVPHVTRFWIAPNSQSVAYLVQKQAENKQYLVVENLQNRTTTTYAGVTESAYDASGRYLALVQKRQASTSVVVLDVHTNIAHTLYTSTKNNFSHLVWSPTGGRIAFFEHQANNTVVHAVQCVGNNPKKLNLFSDDLSIDVERRPALFFSDEGTQLFCYIKKTKKEPKAKKQKATTVEIWNTKDELLYPGYGYRKEKVENPSMMLAWQIEKNEWQMIGDSIHNTTLVGSKATYAYGYSNKTHSLSYAESEPQSTIELYNLVTGSQTSVVEKPHGFEFQMSPSGRYLAYFKQKHWWVYDAETNTHTNITASLKPHFFNKESKEINPSAAYGNPGWSADEKQILLYDKFDLWAITPEGKEAKRLTKGREQARIYRLYRLSQGRFEVPRFEAQYARFFDLKKGVVLSARDIYNEDTGYFHYTNKKGLEQIVFKDFAIKNLRMSKNKKTLIYTEERYNIPRRILRVKADDKKSVL
ncbi:MAG: hypothetical protein CMC13_04295, partial [Flavobacteriaceae bacterium]|nr:hypothetical protein [Flavobacteriaceae bacterium]